MSRQYSITLRDGWNDLYETTIGTSPKLRIYEGDLPLTCAADEIGTLLVEISLPVDWMQPSDQGTIAKTGTWASTAIATGNMNYYRITGSGGLTCHEQGVVGTAGSTPTPDLVVNQTAVEITQSISINTWQITAPGI